MWPAPPTVPPKEGPLIWAVLGSLGSTHCQYSLPQRDRAPQNHRGSQSLLGLLIHLGKCIPKCQQTCRCLGTVNSMSRREGEHRWTNPVRHVDPAGKPLIHTLDGAGRGNPSPKQEQLKGEGKMGPELGCSLMELLSSRLKKVSAGAGC